MTGAKLVVFSTLMSVGTALAGAQTYTPTDMIGTGSRNVFLYGSNATKQIGFLQKDSTDRMIVFTGAPSPVFMSLPTGHISAQGTAIGSTLFFGNARTSAGESHAFKTSVGGPTTLIHPAGWTHSYVYGASGDTTVVGSVANMPSSQRAHVWSGTGHSGTILHPPVAVSSAINCASGSWYGGSMRTTSGLTVGVLWNGLSGSYTVMNPLGSSFSMVNGASSTDQVGTFRPTTSANVRAVRWTFTMTSYTSLHPTAFASSVALGTNGSRQVGYAIDSAGTNHALVWASSSSSYVNLGALLSALGPGWTQSQATTINATGDIAGHAYNSITGLWHPILWKRTS